MENGTGGLFMYEEIARPTVCFFFSIFRSAAGGISLLEPTSLHR